MATANRPHAPRKSEEAAIVAVLNSIREAIPKSIVDVGGNVNAEVSTPFVAMGWKALIIEPQQSAFSKLREKFKGNPNVQLVKKAVANHEGTAKLYWGIDGPGSEVATLSTALDPWMSQVRSSEYEDVAVSSLTKILQEADWPREFGILKVDCESFDPQVIAGLDFSRFRPKAIVTEEYYWEVEPLIAKHLMLEKNDYVNCGFIGYNSVWVCRSLGVNWSFIPLRRWLGAIGKLPRCLEGLAESPELDWRTRTNGPITDLKLQKMRLVVETPANLPRGSRATLSGALINFDDRTIPVLGNAKDEYRIGVSYHWFNPRGKVVVWDGVRTPLLQDIPAKGSMDLAIDVIAPDVSGDYVLTIDLVQENCFWFSDKGFSPVTAKVRVG